MACDWDEALELPLSVGAPKWPAATARGRTPARGTVMLTAKKMTFTICDEVLRDITY